MFQRDPVVTKLPNDGVAAVTDAKTSKEIETLRYELENFVCEGQYRDGLVRVLESYLSNANHTNQPAVWVSGFFGSGKSHLLKMLRHLWVNTRFESDGATARELARLPEEVNDLLKELDTLGRRCGAGLHAAGGSLRGSEDKSLRLSILSMIFSSRDLPESFPQAQFCLWLKNNGIYDDVKKTVKDSGRDFGYELRHLYVSEVLAKSVLEADPDFAPDVKEARTAIREQFSDVNDISESEFIQIIRDVLSVDGQLPCTAIVLDEIQLFIGDSTQRSYDVQEVAEALCKQLDSRVLLIGAGQTALSGSVPLLQRLRDRFTISVELSDSDVETVTRKVVLAKKADKRRAVEEVLTGHAGEIDRHLVGTRIAPRRDDRSIIVEDYPVLPVRYRFWEHVLRAVDVPGSRSQLRAQLRIVHDAVREVAEKPLGTVIPADFIFDNLQAELLQSQVLLRENDETIRNLDNGTPHGLLARRICALVFLIRKLPGETAVDIGVRATADTLADLLVSDLASDGAALRRDVPRILEELVVEGKLIEIDDEYSLQTRESSEWDREFRSQQSRLNNDPVTLAAKRTEALNSACEGAFANLKLVQGTRKERRKLAVYFGDEPPAIKGNEIPAWVRDGWGENESTVVADARAAGSDSPVVFAYIPKTSADDLRRAIIEYEAAGATIDIKGRHTVTDEQDARNDAMSAMTTRMKNAQARRDGIVKDAISKARVFQGGGQERLESFFQDRMRAAAEASLDRLFPQFKDADDERWPTVIKRARDNDESAFQAVDWSEVPARHPVCTAIISEIGSGKSGREIRDTFEKAPYGWPRDAVDAALITLHATGHVRATYKGDPLDRGQLDQAKISVTQFRVETITIDARSRLRLRGLFREAGIRCDPGKESSTAGEFLAKLMNLADGAGGDPPMPKRPSKKHLHKLRQMAGNERLAGILDEFELLSNQLQNWSALSELAERRKPAWAILQSMLRYAQGLPGTLELENQANAVLNERRLLDEPDLVPDIIREAAKLLRDAIRQAYASFKTVYERERQTLEADENWKRISQEQQQKILLEEGIACIPVVSIEDDKSLLSSLEAVSLADWKTKTDALPQQFGNALMKAAKLLEPKIQKVRLPGGTLRTVDDVKTWVAKIEEDLLEKIEKGPVVIS